MAARTELFKRILEDVERYNGLHETVKAGFFERLFTHHLSPDDMHPNPDDEFSMANIGPNEKIIQKYCQEAVECLREGNNFGIYPEPIIVEKMKVGGFMIINGHHRWAGAVKAQVKKVRVAIVNPRQSVIDS